LDGTDSVQQFDSMMPTPDKAQDLIETSAASDINQVLNNMGSVTFKKMSSCEASPVRGIGLTSVMKKKTRTCKALNEVAQYDASSDASWMPSRVPGGRSCSPGPVPRSASRRQELLEELRGRGGQVILPEGGSASSSSASKRFEIGPVDPEVPFVAVAVSLRDAMAGHRAVEQLVQQTLRQPVVVILLESEDFNATSELVERLEETKAFLRLNAHGVYWQPKCNDNLEEIVDYWLVCATERKDMAVQRGQEEQERKDEEDLQRQKASAREAGLFWERAHKVFADLPPLVKELDEPVVGGMVGRHHKIVKPLGAGNFGKVMLASETETKQFKALKVVPKRDMVNFEMVSAVSKEIGFLKRLNHPNIVGFCGAAHSNQHIMLLLEYVGSRNLFEFHRDSGAKSLPRQFSRIVFKQVASGVAYCHSKGVAHRDLKQENIVIMEDGKKVKIVDFGEAASVDATWEVHGTVPFTAPEVMAEEEGSYDAAKADVWSLGVVLVEMLCGLNHFPGTLGWEMPVKPSSSLAKDLRSLVCNWQRLSRGLASEAPRGSWTPGLEALLCGTLTPGSAERWTAASVAEVEW